ncbi:hypothetical protein EYC84_004134 [Monilinia fructicola]|uniref:GATA-type domain-containing protein n=1 Tax=Monilinia fructicola TaxID=38448 RepID=A0A5M9K7R7_MONFR|nr:hypothetical protein EYC84_004134 [Monilinia fructicola]
MSENSMNLSHLVMLCDFTTDFARRTRLLPSSSPMDMLIMPRQGVRRPPHLPVRDTADYCRGFFMMARPYPTKNAVLLDSFLEHKIEFERMSKRIKDLKREEEEEYEDIHLWLLAQPSRFSSDATPAKPDMSHGTLTKANLEDASSSRNPDSINDKMMPIRGCRSHPNAHRVNNIEKVNGVKGLVLVITKKKLKLLDEYVCTDCGTLDSPEWRKGPVGPKTLCNACGLRWAKKEKKQKPEPSNPPLDLKYTLESLRK